MDKAGEALGAGEVVVNSIDTDGVKRGEDIEMLRAVSEAVNIQSSPRGGAGCIEDFTVLFKTLPAWTQARPPPSSLRRGHHPDLSAGRRRHMRENVRRIKMSDFSLDGLYALCDRRQNPKGSYTTTFDKGWTKYSKKSARRQPRSQSPAKRRTKRRQSTEIATLPTIFLS